MMNKKGQLVISLDFELLWGVFDVVNYENKFEYFRNTRKVIPEILALFHEHNVHATWAVVGMLFNKDWNEWEKNRPSKLPMYRNRRLSPYAFIDGLADNEKEKMTDLVFAPELVEMIKKNPGQEIGTHTYSHFYCLEKGQDATEFKKDIEKAIELAEAKRVNFRTLVFPRNQIKRKYLDICSQLGIANVRSNPTDWYWKDTRTENIFTKLARSGDAYLPLGKKTYNFKPDFKDDVLQQPASRFLRPVEANQVLRNLKINRVRREMTNAALRGEAYHLWWHPHNFGNDPKGSLNDLKLILKHYAECRDKFGMQSVNMAEFNTLFSTSVRPKLN